MEVIYIMRKVALRINEEFKYKTTKKLVETNGNKKRSALKLNCSIRTINRLIIKYKKFGKDVFVHNNRDNVPATTIPLYIRNEIIRLYFNHYHNANFIHFCEIVK